jgi:16S rRNA (cytosine1402-N4)-methyltransferase
MKKFHEPVLLEETIDLLKVRKGKKYLDATLGGGGHAEAILKKGGQVLGCDCDPEALVFSRKRLVPACPPSACSWKLVRGNFAHLKLIAQTAGFDQVAGILFDLGVSAHQLLTPGRGFSFTDDTCLDMRMDPSLGVTAADLLAALSQKELAQLLVKFGEEPQARKVAAEIVKKRRQKPIKTGRELASLVGQTLGRPRGKTHPATRVFQALRIAVNDELTSLRETLPQTSDLLEKGGRLVVISFHSLEDRIVKNFFKEADFQGILKILTKKPLVPDRNEIKENPASRSAKLRAAERI